MLARFKDRQGKQRPLSLMATSVQTIGNIRWSQGLRSLRREESATDKLVPYSEKLGKEVHAPVEVQGLSLMATSVQTIGNIRWSQHSLDHPLAKEALHLHRRMHFMLRPAYVPYCLD
jgi:hypothetical protein